MTTYKEKIRAAVLSLLDELDKAEKDAARYRWLRAEHTIIYPIAAVVWKRNYDRKESEWVNTSDVNSLDSSIDAAIEQAKSCNELHEKGAA